MAAPTSSSHDNSSRRPLSSEKRWKGAFHSKLMQESGKPKSSNSLFWDWRKDAQKPPSGKNPWDLTFFLRLAFLYLEKMKRLEAIPWKNNG